MVHPTFSRMRHRIPKRCAIDRAFPSSALPGSIALLISSLGEYILPLSLSFRFCFVYLSLLLFSYILSSLLLCSFILFSLLLFSFIFLIYPKIHKKLKTENSKNFCCMVTFFESNWYWQSGSTEDEQKYYKEYHLSEKVKYVWEQIDRLKFFAGNLCSK